MQLASQKFKDDGSGRMLSGFFSDVLGVLWVTPALVQEINQHRADLGKPPMKIFQIASQATDVEPGARKQRGVYGWVGPI